MAHELDITNGVASFANSRPNAWHRLGTSVGHAMSGQEAMEAAHLANWNVRNMALVIEAMGSAEREVPDYVEVDQKAGTAKFIRMPALSDIPYAARMEPNLVVEYYSS